MLRESRECSLVSVALGHASQAVERVLVRRDQRNIQQCSLTSLTRVWSGTATVPLLGTDIPNVPRTSVRLPTEPALESARQPPGARRADG
jgi:hypothetical protein